ncbi:MAG TPA: hypothetical protein VFE60_13965 [Roseiarcus sp.]|nr:hypothetical protein [Roseiarcus sp.]
MSKPPSETQWPAGLQIRRIGAQSPIFVVFYGKQTAGAFRDEFAAKCALAYWEAQITTTGVIPAKWTLPLQGLKNAFDAAEEAAAMKARLAAMEVQLASRDISAITSAAGKERQKNPTDEEQWHDYGRALVDTASPAIRGNTARLYAWVRGTPGKPGKWAFKDADGKLIRACPGRTTFYEFMKRLKAEGWS